jgi:TonB family protein
VKLADILKKAGGVGPEMGRDSIPVEPDQQVDKKPEMLNSPRANYTDLAAQAGIRGVVRARVLFGADGKIKKIRILTGLPYGLSDEAIVAIKYLRFKPAIKNGQAVPYWAPVEMVFQP